MPYPKIKALREQIRQMIQKIVIHFVLLFWHLLLTMIQNVSYNKRTVIRNVSNYCWKGVCL